MTKHIAQSGKNAGQWVNCPAELQCTLKSRHIDNSYLQATKTWLRDEKQVKKNMPQITPQDVDDFMRSPNAVLLVEVVEKKAATGYETKEKELDRIREETRIAELRHRLRYQRNFDPELASEAQPVFMSDEEKEKRRLSEMLSSFFGISKTPKKDAYKRLPYDEENPRSYKPTKLYYNGADEPWWIAPAGRTGIQCHKCGDFASYESVSGQLMNGNALHVCSRCGTSIVPGDEGTFINDQGLRMLDKRNVEKEVWYHSTQNPNWVEDINKEDPIGGFPLAHFGTKTASEMRASRLYAEEWDKRPFYLYELRVKPGTYVANSIIEDEDEDAPQVSKEIPDNAVYSKNGITRYFNYWEDPGSVSLLSPASNFEVISKKSML
jgi:hypothetical protein